MNQKVIDLYNQNQDKYYWWSVENFPENRTRPNSTPIREEIIVVKDKNQFEFFFNPKFGACEAIWGTGEKVDTRLKKIYRFDIGGEDYIDSELKAFEYHKQQMAIAPDIDKYLEDNCPEDV